MNNIELVYFVFPSCDANCKHCWSSDLMLGRVKSLEWHYRLIDRIASSNTYSTIKLSGGEPFKNKDIGKLANRLHEKIGPDLPIQIFTSGRPFVSLKRGREGVEETLLALDSYFDIYDNISIQLSVDEFHVQVLERMYKEESNIAELARTFIENFMQACFEIMKKNPKFKGPKLKMHCAAGRIEHHLDFYSWFPQDWWNEYVILTEGLVSSGNGKKLENTYKIVPNEMISYFLLPGVNFYPEPKSSRAVLFEDNGKTAYLDDSDEHAILIEGWWNIIDRRLKYQVYEV